MPEEYLLKHYDESLSIDMRAAMASAEAVLEVVFLFIEETEW